MEDRVRSGVPGGMRKIDIEKAYDHECWMSCYICGRGWGLGRGECDGLEVLRFLGMISGSHPVSLRVREV